ncbi:glycosyltransferase [Candidatus Margulisiibacteriota bacterium]
MREKNKLKLLYVGDAALSLAFRARLSQSGIAVDARYKILGGLRGPKSIVRHLLYMWLALQAVARRKDYDHILIWQQYIGIYYALLSMIYPFNRKSVAVFYIIFKKNSNKIVNIAKKWLFVRVFNSKYIEKAIFINKNDYIFRGIGRKKRYVADYPARISEYIESNLEKVAGSGSFFAGGVSNRDYAVLKNLALADAGLNFKIVSTAAQIKQLGVLPPNIEAGTELEPASFEEALLRSKAVIIPLKDPNVVSGQLVLISALQAGKVVFISKNIFLEDWLNSSETGQFIFTYRDAVELTNLIKRISDTELKARGHQARAFFQNSLSAEKMYNRLIEIILES